MVYIDTIVLWIIMIPIKNKLKSDFTYIGPTKQAVYGNELVGRTAR